MWALSSRSDYDAQGWGFRAEKTTYLGHFKLVWNYLNFYISYMLRRKYLNKDKYTTLINSLKCMLLIHEPNTILSDFKISEGQFFIEWY